VLHHPAQTGSGIGSKLKCVTGCVPAFVEIREDGGGGPTGFWVPAGVPAVLKPAWNQDVDDVFQRVKAACNGPGMVPPPIQWEIGQCTVGPWWDPTNTGGTTQPAWGSPRTIKICITTVGNPSNQSLAKRLKHELEHAYQACKSYQLANPSVPWNAIQTDWNDPDNMICREVNAYCAVAPAGTCKGAPGSLQPDGPQAANSVCGDACEILYDSQTQKAQHATCAQACTMLAPSCVDGHK